ncbi:MAG TPA: hypothetical protein VGS20_07260 [Candidatus Acidoferrales bacterium]|nr:hypothetical protein [Candidatus Acidoferrales bacterium]
MNGKGLWVAIVVFSVVASGVLAQAPRRRRVSAKEAEALVRAALPRKTVHLPKFELLPSKQNDRPRFYSYSAIWEGEPHGSAVIGNYDVDSATGDVFSGTVGCYELSTPALRKLQARIRARIGLSDAEYHKVKTKGQLCP